MRRTVLIDPALVDARMAELSWSASELSRQSGVSRPPLYSALRGENTSRRTILKIAEALGVEPSQITRVEASESARQV